MKPALTFLAVLLLEPLAELRAAESKSNVLFIAMADLRPWIGAMGFLAAKTPNLDRLAARSVIFSRAYRFPPALGQPQKDPAHTSNFGLKLQEKCKAVGVSCELVYPGAPDCSASGVFGVPARQAKTASSRDTDKVKGNQIQ